jgi:hypothetical protein
MPMAKRIDITTIAALTPSMVTGFCDGYAALALHAPALCNCAITPAA